MAKEENLNEGIEFHQELMMNSLQVIAETLKMYFLDVSPRESVTLNFLNFKEENATIRVNS
jgi:hypothetical protein